MKKIITMILCLVALATVFAQSKPTLAVLPFSGGTGTDGNDLAQIFEDYLRGGFRVVSRDSRITDSIFKEANIQRSGLTDSDRIAALGKQLNAQYVVAGHITKLGNKNLLLISVVNVVTFQQIAGDFKEYGRIDETLDYMEIMSKRIEAAAKMATDRQPKLAVLPFNIDTTINPVDAKTLAQILAIEVTNTGKYAVLPRTSEINKVMKEQNIQRSGLTDQSSIKEIGKATNAEYVLSGSVLKVGETNLFRSFIVHIESGETHEGTSVRYVALADGIKLMPELSEKLTGVKAVQAAKAPPPPPPPQPKTYSIGARGPAGGFIFYDKGYTSDGWRYLEAAPADLPNKLEWGAYEKNVSGTRTEIGSGKNNTQVIVTYLNRIRESNKAAQAATYTEINGYKDWFLPSKDELDMLYKNLKQKGLGNFGSGVYWSSSQTNTGYAWVQSFSDGGQGGDYKNYTDSVRVVRAF